MSDIWKLVFAASLLFTICYSSIAAAQPASRIIGGAAVPDDRYPFMVSIFYDPTGEGNFFPDCGGTIVGSRWVMTAAHCMVDLETGEQTPASRVAVLVGALDLSDESQGTLIVAQNTYMHPDYNNQTNVSDIALIELPETVSLPVISLPVAGSDVPIVDELATSVGWGQMDADGNRATDLQEASVQIVAHSHCLPFYSTMLQLDANVCAGGTVSSGRNGCPGDSGGPLFVERDGLWVQAGITSYGKSCVESNIPGVYTRVSSHTDWVAGFVPDLQISNSSSGMIDNADVSDDSAVVVLSADSPSSNGNLLQGEVAVYEVTGATRVDLHSQSGDVDLLIVTGTTFDGNNIVCISENVTPLDLDACDLPSTLERVYAIVYIYEDSTYKITAVRESETVDVTNPPALVDPPDVQEPPVGDPPVVEVPPVVEEPPIVGTPIVEPPVVEQPSIDDSPIIVAEAPNDDTQLPTDGGGSGDGSSSGGTLGGLSLLILSALALGRGRSISTAQPLPYPSLPLCRTYRLFLAERR